MLNAVFKRYIKASRYRVSSYKDFDNAHFRIGSKKIEMHKLGSKNLNPIPTF